MNDSQRNGNIKTLKGHSYVHKINKLKKKNNGIKEINDVNVNCKTF